MKRILSWAVLALCVCGLAALAQAQMVVQSLSGPVTQTEIDSFRTFMQGQTVPPDNTGDAYGHHTGSQRFDALGLMYLVSHDQGILDIYVHWVDTALHARNNPVTGCIAWTGNRELFWPTSVNADGTCGASTNGEQGWVISHQAWVAEEILRTPAIWNQAVRIGDPFGFGTTYLDRAKTYVRELDRTEDTFIIKNFVRASDHQWRFPSSSSGYNGSTWFGLPFPWNQQMMLSGGLLRLANAHLILGDDSTRVALYNSIIQESWNFWQSSDLASASCKGLPVYRWHYVNQSAPNTSIENTGHAAFDMWGLYMLTLGSGRFGISDNVMTTFANTTASCMDLGTAWAQNIDGSGATQTNLQPQFFLLAKWVPSLYTRIANSDTSFFSGTPIYTAGVLWAKNARATGCWNDAGCSGGGGTFSLSANPATRGINAGGSTTYAITVTPSGGFSSAVTLGVSGLPSGASGSFSPASVSGGSGTSTLTVTTSGSTPQGTYTLTINGTGGGQSGSTPVTLAVNVPPPPDFSLSVSPSSQTVAAGGSTTYTATVTPANGFSGSVSVSVSSGLPSGVTASTCSATSSCTLTVTASSTAAQGTATLTITGTSGSLTHSTTVSLTIVLANVCTTTTANATWNNFAFPAHSGSFTATFDATPSVNGQSSAVGLSHGAQTAYSGFANIVVFTTAGTIQARNGGVYAGSVSYSGGNAYHFRLAINVTTHTYSIFVTAPGGIEQTVGSNFAFRTEQNTVTSLDHWGALVNTAPGGTLKVCNFTAQ